jgi:hypothetical protein
VLVLDFLDHGYTVDWVLLWYTSLTSAIFCERPRLLCQSIVLLLENANLTAVYGCTSDKVWISPGLVLSIVSLIESLRSTWLASNCNRWSEASYHLLATLDNSALPWNVSLGTIVEQIPRW